MAGASQDWIEKDFYRALGVDKSASDDEIKKAYRKLARQYHPDRNPGDKKAEERFKEVSEAYQVLSNEQDRQQYDALRSFAGGGARFSAGGAGSSSAGFEDILSQMFGGGGNVRFQTSSAGVPGGGFENVFSSLFSGNGQAASGFGQQRGFTQPPQRGEDMQTTLSLPLRKAVTGTTVKLRTGKGKHITVKIPAGIGDGETVRVPGAGKAGIAGGKAGDVVVTVHVEAHPVFSVRGRDIFAKVPVSVAEAAAGAVVSVPTVEGKMVKIKIPPATSSGKKFRVKGKGLASKKGHGDMYAVINIVMPQELDADALKAAELFGAATRDFDPRKDFNELAHM